MLVASCSTRSRLHTFAPPIPPCPNLSRAPSSLSHPVIPIGPSPLLHRSQSARAGPSAGRKPSATHPVTASFVIGSSLVIRHLIIRHPPHEAANAQFSADFARAPFTKGVAQIGDNVSRQSLVFPTLRAFICHLENPYPPALRRNSNCPANFQFQMFQIPHFPFPIPHSPFRPSSFHSSFVIPHHSPLSTPRALKYRFNHFHILHRIRQRRRHGFVLDHGQRK